MTHDATVIHDDVDEPAATRARITAHKKSATDHRRISLIWETTQAAIAVAVTMTTLYVAGSLAVRGGADFATFGLLSNAFFLVIGFYFGRVRNGPAGDAGGRLKASSPDAS
jgi:hypothetical protein